MPRKKKLKACVSNGLVAKTLLWIRPEQEVTPFGMERAPDIVRMGKANYDDPNPLNYLSDALLRELSIHYQN